MIIHVGLHDVDLCFPHQEQRELYNYIGLNIKKGVELLHLQKTEVDQGRPF